MKKQFKADLALLIVTVGWGTSFLLTKVSLSEISTYNFLALRFVIAFLVPTLVFYKEMKKIGRQEIKYGVIVGLILFSTYALQTVGLNYTTVSKSAFITGFNVVLVPICSTIILKTSIEKKAYLSATVAFIGIALLTLNDSITNINIGDLYSLLCSIMVAFYVVFVGKYTRQVESIPFAIIQLGTVAVLSIGTSFIFENPTFTASTRVWIYVVILGLICTALAFIVQNIAQKYTSPEHTALIYACEPVFAAAFAYIMTGEVLTLTGVFGAFLILAGMIISEVDFKKTKV